jgi:hypothetical protein
MQITGRDCYEYGGIPNPYNPLDWDELSDEDKAAWEEVAKAVTAIVEAPDEPGEVTI